MHGVDLMLLHWPCDNQDSVAAYKQIEALAFSGKARAIGVSNCRPLASLRLAWRSGQRSTSAASQSLAMPRTRACGGPRRRHRVACRRRGDVFGVLPARRHGLGLATCSATTVKAIAAAQRPLRRLRSMVSGVLPVTEAPGFAWKRRFGSLRPGFACSRRWQPVRHRESETDLTCITHNKRCAAQGASTLSRESARAVCMCPVLIFASIQTGAVYRIA